MVREGDVLPKDVRKGRIPVLALERGGSVQHLVDENAQSPPVDSAGVAASLDHLRRDVLLSADKRVGPEVGDAGLGIDRGQRRGARSILANNHCWLAARIGLFRQVKV